MAKKSESIYNNVLNLHGEIIISLSVDERSMICNALTKCASQEADIIPIVMLMDRIVKGE